MTMLKKAKNWNFDKCEKLIQQKAKLYQIHGFNFVKLQNKRIQELFLDAENILFNVSKKTTEHKNMS